jgi:hypothetical protein
VADFAADRADAGSAGEVRFGAAAVFAQGGEDAFVCRRWAAEANRLCARNISTRHFGRRMITGRLA